MLTFLTHRWEIDIREPETSQIDWSVRISSTKLILDVLTHPWEVDVSTHRWEKFDSRTRDEPVYWSVRMSSNSVLDVLTHPWESRCFDPSLGKQIRESVAILAQARRIALFT